MCAYGYLHMEENFGSKHLEEPIHPFYADLLQDTLECSVKSEAFQKMGEAFEEEREGVEEGPG